MLKLTLPDGKVLELEDKSSGMGAALKIGKRLAQDALAIVIDGEVRDLSRPIEKDAKIRILTFNDKDGKEVFRHSTAHVFAHAIKNLYPSAKPTIGPAVEEGFYYDFDDLKITPSDFPKIEAEMQKIVGENHLFQRHEWTLGDVKKHAAKNQYKKELAEDFARKGWTLTAYSDGDFIDLCEGPHVPSTGIIKAIKLTNIASAYWRGDQKNKQLTRIYGISFPSLKELKEWEAVQVELEKRDHRKIGKEQDLFLFSDLVGSGLPLWTAKGTIIRTLLDDFVWHLRKERGYEKVTIPHITKKDLYVTSGHWAKYADDLFKIKTREGHEFAMKPMSCPHHTQIYAHLKRSYRDLPQRYCETTMVYRDEQSGELSGLSRVLCITQDDAHVFCRESQVKEEGFKIWDIIDKFYGVFGFNLKIRLSLHDPTKFEKYIGTKDQWEFAENQLREMVKERKADAVDGVGEAAFYGPKLDFMAQDSLGRKWQVATLQIDRNMPERFNLNCTSEKGQEERIVILHAAIMGSLERFVSVLIEHLAGKWPLWLNPEQVRVLCVADKFESAAAKLVALMQSQGIRATLDNTNETINKKVRDAQLAQVNYILVFGEKEVAGQLQVRTRENVISGPIQQEEFIRNLQREIASRKL